MDRKAHRSDQGEDGEARDMTTPTLADRIREQEIVTNTATRIIESAISAMTDEYVEGERKARVIMRMLAEAARAGADVHLENEANDPWVQHAQESSWMLLEESEMQ